MCSEGQDFMGKNTASAIAKQDRVGLMYVSPFFIHFLAFLAIPIFFTTAFAFFNADLNFYYDLIQQHDMALIKESFVGFENFRELARDQIFWIAVRNTFSIWIISTIPMLILAFGVASLLANPYLRANIFWRTTLMIPNITSILAVTIVFQQIFDRDFGMVNQILFALGRDNPVEWVDGLIPSHVAIATMIDWRWIGYNALVFLAAILAIPKELYESASLDGATRSQVLRFVTIPQLRNTITFMLIVGTIGGLGLFIEPFIYGGYTYLGGIDSQFMTLNLYLFKYMLDAQRWGYAAAVGVAITFIVIIISAVNFMITRRIASEDSK